MAEAPGTIEERDDAFDAAFVLASEAAESGKPLPEDNPAGEDTTKAAGGEDTTKAAGGEDTTKGAGGEDTTKAAGGEDTTKAAGGEDTTKGAGGEDTTKGAGGEDTTKGAGALDDKIGGGKTPAAPEKTPEPVKPPEKTPEQLAAEKKQKDDLDAALADYSFSEEEKADLDHWAKEFPREAKAVEAKLKQIDRIITQRVYNAAQAVLEYVESRVKPAVQGYQQSALKRHMQTIQAAHADHEQLRPLVKEWIATQPAYLRTAMEQTYESGAAQDVVDLYMRFKTETGRVKAAPAVKEPAKEPAKKTPSKDDVDALAPVGGKRVTPGAKGAADPNDYDGAWKEAAGG